MPAIPASLAVLALILVCAWAFRQHRNARLHRRAIGDVLDAADALEARLRTARAEIEAVAGEDENPVREAMQEMLRQRLWLQRHGSDASAQQLNSVRDSIDHARHRIDQQLLQIERARAPLH